MNTCKTCKWWDAENENHRGYTPPVDGHPCKCPKIDDSPHYRVNGDLAAPSESGTFFTGPDFGCVHHEPIPPEPVKVPDELLQELSDLLADTKNLLQSWYPTGRPLIDRVSDATSQIEKMRLHIHYLRFPKEQE